MDVRPYRAADRAACLHVFDSLAPHLIGFEARPRYESFLDSMEPDSMQMDAALNQPHYFVLEHDDAVAGCGGFGISADCNSATLLWGMVRDDVRNLGLGRFLLLYRMREIGKAGNVPFVVAETFPSSAAFLQKQGFRVQGVEGGLVSLTMKLTVCP